MVDFDLCSNILKEMNLRNELDWEKMSQEDKAKFKAVVIQFKRYFEEMLINIEAWESIYGKVMDIGSYDMFLE